MPATADTPADLVLPALDLRALARRAAVPAALAAVVVAALVVAGGPLQAFADALGRAVDADPRWVVAAATFEVLSFVGYVSLLWLVGSRASNRLDLRASTQITLGGAGATRLLPTGGVGGAALTIWAFRRAGLGTRGATRTLLAFLVVLYSVFLGSIAIAGGAIALGISHADGPLALSALPAAAAVTAMAAALALAAFAKPFSTDAAAAAPVTGARSLVARVRAAAGDTPAALGTGVRDALALVRSGDPRLLGALAWWGFDAAVLWAMLHALGAPPSLAVVVLGYFVGQVANTIPDAGRRERRHGRRPRSPSASTRRSRSPPCSPTARSRSGCPRRSASPPSSGLRRTTARWSAEDAPAEAVTAAPERRPAARPLPLRPRSEAA